jgi:hypothetical protein
MASSLCLCLEGASRKVLVLEYCENILWVGSRTEIK